MIKFLFLFLFLFLEISNALDMKAPYDEEFMKGNFNQKILKDSVSFTYGKGENLYLFTDIECPACLKVDLKKIDKNKKINIILYPIFFHRLSLLKTYWVFQAKTNKEKLKRYYYLRQLIQDPWSNISIVRNDLENNEWIKIANDYKFPLYKNKEYVKEYLNKFQMDSSLSYNFVIILDGFKDFILQKKVEYFNKTVKNHRTNYYGQFFKNEKELNKFKTQIEAGSNFAKYFKVQNLPSLLDNSYNLLSI
jgi:hypothetical protein